MAQSLRQRNLFAAEDYRVVYDSFKQANFQAYDYDTIRGALTDYIRQQYPENFNDWIQSSEFVALIETLAFLAHSLAFRIDQAGRENFLSTAERRASVLRIADFIGYTPTRHLPARGELKVVSVKTTQDVFSIDGTNLKNATVDFETAFQNYLLIMNEMFNTNNKFGRPTDSTRIGNVKHDIYSTNITEERDVVFSFNGQVNGARQQFEVHGLEINTGSNSLRESEPNPFGKFDIVYKNDGQGLNSNSTGFFVGFKQGNLQFNDVNADRAVSNLILDLNAQNVNNTDVWVQEIDQNGEPRETWQRVDSSFGANMIFNSERQDVRKLYTVKTVDNDNVNIQFGDGVFSEIPRGTIRVWYRTGVNQTYTLAPEDLGLVSFSFRYLASDGNTYNATFNCELQEPVNNAAAQESVTSIKNNAGRVFAAQDRMVTASDYSAYPLTVSENVQKIKAVNRTYAGHSRYIKPRDPTSTYQSADMIANDGYIYRQGITYRSKLDLPSDQTPSQIYNRFLDDLPSNPEIINLFYDSYDAVNIPFDDEETSFEWQQITTGFRGSSGYFTRAQGAIEKVGTATLTDLNTVREGSIVEFVETPYIQGAIGFLGEELRITNPGTGYTSAPTVEIRGTGTGAEAIANIQNGQVVQVVITNPGQGYLNPVTVAFVGGGGEGAEVAVTAVSPAKTWARVVDVIGDGQGVLDDNGIPTGLTSRGKGAIVLNKSIPNTARVSRVFPAYRTNFDIDLQQQILTEIQNLSTFGLRYDATVNRWFLIRPGDLGPASQNQADNFSLQFAGDRTNNNLDNSWLIRADYSADSWTFTSRRRRIVFGSDQQIRFYNQNGRRRFNVETNKPDRDRIIVSKINTQPNGNFYPLGIDMPFFTYRYYTEPDGYTDDRKVIVTLADIDNDNYPDNPLAFKELVGTDNIEIGPIVEDGFEYTVRVEEGDEANGRFDLNFIWRRISTSEYRIDPSLSNIIDIYVLNQNYDTKYRQWLADDRIEANRPEAPTEIELERQFAALDTKKTVSDSIVYRAAEYKTLFGELADVELQGKFKIVKVSGTTLTNNEIKSRVLTAIRDFFDIANWDFGETFYFTELSAYIHQELPGVISSIVLVPTATESDFGDLFQITPESNELFIPDVTLQDIEIVETLNSIGRRNG
jgi:hypothetical protein